MSATDELREMLDERGVEWFESITRKGLTWICQDGKTIRFHPWQHNTLKVSMFDLTPEQAVAATLGAETCRRLPADNYDVTCIVRGRGYEMEFGYWKCSECGTNCFEGARYCMSCGKKVVDE